MRVQDILKTKNTAIITVSGDIEIGEASRRIASARIGMLLVVDDAQKLVGTLSERDIVRFVATNGSHALSARVEMVMSEAMPVVDPQDSVMHVMRVMTEQRVRHMPVVSQGDLVGVISIGDILKSRLIEKDEEAAVLRDIARASLATAV